MYRALVMLGATFVLLLALWFTLTAPSGRAQPTFNVGINDIVPGGRVTSGYCERVRNGVTETHAGVDIAVISGTQSLPVTVTAGITGHVAATYPFTGHHYPAPPASSNSDWLRNFNSVVISDSTSHNFFFYCHFSQIMPGIVPSATVVPGTPIGIIGGMGANCTNTFGNHLHLEIRQDVGTAGWGSDEVDLVVGGTKTSAISPTLTIGPNVSVTVNSEAGGGLYYYEIVNDARSNLPVEMLRIGYGGKHPYIVKGVPPGWGHSLWEESPDWVWFYALEPAAAVLPGLALPGFAYFSPDLPGQVPFFVAYDDAGHSGGLGRTSVTVWGVSGRSVIYLPLVLRRTWLDP
ncbi:MAG: M23 family metallopeptidase [Chloroflexi bacterium]|nr:M23 family metallopeptidase [Chloroflexota bacterium]